MYLHMTFSFCSLGRKSGEEGGRRGEGGEEEEERERV